MICGHSPDLDGQVQKRTTTTVQHHDYDTKKSWNLIASAVTASPNDAASPSNAFAAPSKPQGLESKRRSYPPPPVDSYPQIVGRHDRHFDRQGRYYAGRIRP